MTKYLFYPGCSMTRSARPYLDSIMAIQTDLALELENVRDWNCCGATEYASVHPIPAYALISRNLALAQQQVDGTNTVIAGCSACYLNLAKTEHYLRNDAKLKAKIDDALAAGGLSYDPGTVHVRHILDILVYEIGLEVIKEKVVKPLHGLRVAPYYGCMVNRPDLDDRFQHDEYPLSLDRLLSALGATIIDFPLKTHCCGGHMTQISRDVAFEMLYRLIAGGDRYHADLLVTICPMCQLNLDAYQDDMNKHFKTAFHMPVLFFTQLMGIAFGHDPKALGLGKEFVDARPALAKIGVELPPEEAAPKAQPRRKKDDPSLPMPRMAEKEVAK